MRILAPVLVLSLIAMLIVCGVVGSVSSLIVLLAAVATFYALTRVRIRLPAVVYARTYFGRVRVIELIVGLVFWIMAMLGLGQIACTYWAYYFGHNVYADLDPSNLAVVAVLVAFALMILRFIKAAAVLVGGFLFSLILGSAANELLFKTPAPDNAIRVSIYAAVFVLVFGLGRYFRWSKKFALGGLLIVFALYLRAYSTM